MLSCSLLVLLASILVGSHYGIGYSSQYVFSESTMQQIAKEAIQQEGANGASAIIADVVKRMHAEYPSYIDPNATWLFNNAGGAMGAMIVLHASLSEYVIIFGTAIGTEGHTGRFLADDYFTILYGEQWAYEAGGIEKEVYQAGDQHHLKLGEAKGYRMPEACWALEYARGNIPSMMLFGLADGFSSTVDLVTIYQTFKVSLQSMVGNMMKGKI